MSDPAKSFLSTAEAAQAGAGVIAARHRGDLASAEKLLEGLGEREKAAGFLFLADLAVVLLSRYEDRQPATSQPTSACRSPPTRPASERLPVTRRGDRTPDRTTGGAAPGTSPPPVSSPGDER